MDSHQSTIQIRWTRCTNELTLGNKEEVGMIFRHLVLAPACVVVSFTDMGKTKGEEVGKGLKYLEFSFGYNP